MRAERTQLRFDRVEVRPAAVTTQVATRDERHDEQLLALLRKPIRGVVVNLERRDALPGRIPARGWREVTRDDERLDGRVAARLGLGDTHLPEEDAELRAAGGTQQE